MPTEQEAEEAKAELARAIQKCYDVLAPGEYISSWVLIDHRRSTELEQQNRSIVAHMTPTGQSWVETRGLLSIVFDAERAGVHSK